VDPRIDDARSGGGQAGADAEEESFPVLGEDADPRGAAITPKVETLVVTRGAAGALAVRGDERVDVRAEPVREVVDTTGAGDLFAAGFLYGEAAGKSLAQSLRLGAICAAEIIQHYGARPEADLRALAGELAA
jgi:sugar/nucleoside kinase (ribokinase family)